MSHRIVRRTALAGLLTAGLGVALAPVASAAPAPGSPFVGGGYVVTTDSHAHRVSVTLTVPTIPCKKGSKYHALRVGAFGIRHGGSHTKRWSITVRAWCTDGTLRTNASVHDKGFSIGLKVNAGDEVRLSGVLGVDYEIDDLTTGHGIGEGTAGPRHVKYGPTVFVGGRLTGYLPSEVTVPFTNVKINKTKLLDTTHRDQTQVRGTTTVVRPTAISEDAPGSFAVVAG